MLLLKKLLDKLYKANARVFKPVPEADLRALRMKMARDKMPALPADYIQFLTLTDGLMYNGLRFWGVKDHEREKQGYTYPCLLSVNEDFYARNRRQDILLIGEKDEDLLVYSPSEKVYQIMDKMLLMPDLNLPRFFDVIYFFSQTMLDDSKLPELTEEK